MNIEIGPPFVFEFYHGMTLQQVAELLKEGDATPTRVESEYPEYEYQFEWIVEEYRVSVYFYGNSLSAAEVSY